MGHQRQCAQAQVVVAGALAGPERGMGWKQQRVAPAFALGHVDPACQPRDACFMAQRRQRAPVQHHFDADRLLVFAYQQAVAARRVFPGNAARGVAGTIGSQLVQLFATGMGAGVQWIAATFRKGWCQYLCLLYTSPSPRDRG